MSARSNLFFSIYKSLSSTGLLPLFASTVGIFAWKWFCAKRRSKSISDEDKAQLAQRRALVRAMAIEAWTAYCSHAWSHETLIPSLSDPFDFCFGTGSGHSLVLAMSTLWVLGFHSEFARARHWVATSLRLESIKSPWSVSHTVSDYIASFLSCYFLTGDELFLAKARQFADSLHTAYSQSPSAFPYQNIRLKDGQVNRDHTSTTLSDVCAGLLEFAILSDLTGDPKYQKRSEAILCQLDALFAHVPLPLARLDILDQFDHRFESNLAAHLLTDSREFYRGLLICSIHRASSSLFHQYVEHIEALRTAQMFAHHCHNISEPILFGSSILVGRQEPGKANTYQLVTHYSGAYVGGMLAQGAYHAHTLLPQNCSFAQQHRTLASQLATTFNQLCLSTRTGLPPYRVDLAQASSIEPNHSNESHHCSFYLTPELAETYFHLYRTTGEARFREYAWQLAQSIYKHCRTICPRNQTITGYSGIKSVHCVDRERNQCYQFQDAYFLGATIKYLYLIFCDERDDAHLPISPNKWLFNCAGQPLLLRHHYPKKKSSLCKIF